MSSLCSRASTAAGRLCNSSRSNSELLFLPTPSGSTESIYESTISSEDVAFLEILSKNERREEAFILFCRSNLTHPRTNAQLTNRNENRKAEKLQQTSKNVMHYSASHGDSFTPLPTCTCTHGNQPAIQICENNTDGTSTSPKGKKEKSFLKRKAESTHTLRSEHH